jgi:hypothetical protein
MKKGISVTLLLLIFTVVWIGACSSDKTKANAKQQISYNFDIRPILSDKCFACHGPDANKREAGFRLDIMDSAFAPLKETEGAFAIVAGKPELSELIKRVTSTDPSYQMPTPESHLGVLSQQEINLLTSWITQGAKYEKHWAFTKPTKATLPTIENKDWVKNELDNFVLEAMEQKNLSPNKEADKLALLKRISLDVTGLLPSLKMLDEFEKDKASNAYEAMVDTMLASPKYGEKMGLLWLDVSRYADSYGYQDDNIRTQWPYRDWVIHAFNKNMAYDKFITWQLAGDMLPNANKEQILATAFLRNHKYTEEGGVIPEEYRVEYIIDKVKTFSKGVLALTAECAQCHDHKYDPISQKAYYQLFAFFNTTKEVGYEGDVSVSKPAKQPVLELSPDDFKQVVSFINKKDTGGMMVSVMGELDTPRLTYILNRGQYDQPSLPVKANAPASVMQFDTTQLPRNRLGLAQWTVDKNNPLTARVFVNMLWQEIFGKGIVKTTGDFGMQGNLPSHPQLLDWLAVDFMEHNWDIKYLFKKILLSATYRQSATISKAALQTDPENIYLSHAPRQRVKAEFVKDVLLSTSGLLNTTIGGPSVKPYQPKGLWESATSGRGVLATYKQDHNTDLYRRGMYTFIKLTVPPPNMIMFDASNRDQCEVKRSNTNTPLQALAMMNDVTMLEASRVFAQNLVATNNAITNKLNTAFKTIICRNPSTKELEILQAYYDDQLKLFTTKKIDADKIVAVGEYAADNKVDKNKTAALMRVISTIYNMEEAITKI